MALKLQYSFIFALFILVQSKNTNNLWCLNSIEPKTKYAFLEVDTYHPTHCNIMCNASSTCDMFTYYYNYSCKLYSYNKIDLPNVMFISNTNVWGTCLMSDISKTSTIVGVQMAKSLNLTQYALCIINYNTRGHNIYKTPPEPSFSPQNLSKCWDACLNRSDCTHIVYQPKYKEMSVSACWLKDSYNQDIDGTTGFDIMTQASCFKSKEIFETLGYDESFEFLFIKNLPPSKSDNYIHITSLLVLIITIIFNVIISLCS